MLRPQERTRYSAILWIVIMVAGSEQLQARPTIRQAFFAAYPVAVGSRLDSTPSKTGHCGVCHYDFNGGGPKNAYGQAVLDSGFALNTDVGRSNAIYSLRGLDKDGDGFSTDGEVFKSSAYPNAPTFPGLKTTNQTVNVPVAEIQNYLTPTAGGDTVPPAVRVLTPNGGQNLTANRATNVTWTATDASGIASVSIYLSLDNGVSYRPIAVQLNGTETFSWVPANRPSAQARIKVVAWDTYGNSSNDVSDNVFTISSPAFTNEHGVATTLRDFDMPGTQPFEHGMDLEASANCAQCHGGYDPVVEPHFNWQGSMMAQASRDPLFLANMAIANQDAAESGDLCLRCHLARGWMAGRSVPTDGSRMQPADRDGVSCALCHRMVEPVYAAGQSPTNDGPILATLSFPGTNFGNGMFVVDPAGTLRGPFTNAAAPHAFLVSPFHQKGAFCGTCHDVSNPAFKKDAQGIYQPDTFNASATDFSPHALGPVERTYSEWLHSQYNSAAGVYAPAFAGNKPGGAVSTCQDCHMRKVIGQGCNLTNAPVRPDLPLHDMTGGSTWLPGLLTNLYPAEVNAAAIRAGIQRANQLLSNAASMAVAEVSGQLKVTVTNECGHKLPTGYPEGRRVWINVKFFNESMTLLAESGAYDFSTGVLHHDQEVKIYEVHPGIDINISGLLDLDPAPSLHFVLNNKIYEDNRIPPRGFTNAIYASFGGAPVGHSYADGQYWDDTLYAKPSGATRAEVRLYYQSTSKEFIEFLRDENRTNTKGQEMYDLWRTNGMCPPTLMAQATWQTPFTLKSAQMTAQGHFRAEFICAPGATYTIEYTDSLDAAHPWRQFMANGTFTATSTAGSFEDDFTANTSGAASTTGQRYYRFKYTLP